METLIVVLTIIYLIGMPIFTYFYTLKRNREDEQNYK